ncbi:right-handed parallel beta-helix repeat-containing protein, partial [bacterium]|nr:right-handed parallel beta-helix repeat-containing protein [bacterium]
MVLILFYRRSSMKWMVGIVLWIGLIADLRADSINVPDDYQTIQGAIDAASSGDIVLVQPGTFRERVKLKSGVTLRSIGNDDLGGMGLKRAERTIIDGSEGDVESPGILMAQDSVVDGFTVTGVGRYDDALWDKHHATGGDEQSYDDIGKPGIAGISVIGIANCEVFNNIVHHIGYSGIVVMGADGIRVAPRIHNNVAYRNMGGGIGAMMGCSAVIESNRCFENFYAGIGHASGATTLVIDNECFSNLRAGIGISEGARPIVRGNKCYENRRAGIGVRT